MAEIDVKVPAILKISNTSDINIPFVPYRENFVTSLAKGKAIEFSVETSGQALYYLKQATNGLTVEQKTTFDSTADGLTIFEVPGIMTLTNTTEKGVRTFVPYRENFEVSIQGGDSYKIEVKNLGQILYYLAQETDDLTVTYAKKAQD